MDGRHVGASHQLLGRHMTGIGMDWSVLQCWGFGEMSLCRACVVRQSGSKLRRAKCPLFPGGVGALLTQKWRGRAKDTSLNRAANLEGKTERSRDGQVSRYFIYVLST